MVCRNPRNPKEGRITKQVIAEMRMTENQQTKPRRVIET